MSAFDGCYIFWDNKNLLLSLSQLSHAPGELSQCSYRDMSTWVHGPYNIHIYTKYSLQNRTDQTDNCCQVMKHICPRLLKIT